MLDDFSRLTETDDAKKDTEPRRKRLERLSEILRRSRTMPASADDWQQTINQRLSAQPQSESGILPDGSEDGG